LHHRFELPRPDDRDFELRSQRRGGEDRLEPVQGDQLADEQEVVAWRPRRVEDPLLRADEADGEAAPRQMRELGEVRCIRFGVGNDDVGCAQRGPVDPLEQPCSDGAGSEAAAI